MASHYGDAASACRALTRVGDREVLERTLEEMAVARAAQGDWDGARDLVRYVQANRPVGSAALSRTYARMVSNTPPAWSPDRFGIVRSAGAVFRIEI
jgi:hypothetical protein